MKARTFWILGGVVVVATLVVAAALPVVQRNQAQATSSVVTGTVTTVTAVSSVESSGSVEALQSDSLFWKTTGTVATVNVEEGDTVKAGEVLMTVDPATAPQNVILAQSDLINARNALDELLHPADTAVANAEKAMADAQDALDKARRDLRSVENPAGQSLYNTVDDTKLALDTAAANRQLADNSADVQAYYTAVANTDAAFRRYQDAQARYDESNNKTELLNRLEQARAAYESALSQQQTLELKINTDKANKDDALEEAQDKYDDAVANLNAALQGPDANKLAIAKAKVAVAEANLADARDKLNELLNGADPDDIAAAEARVLAAQATANSLTLIAPFAGEVLAVNYQPGDSISQAQAAVVLANRSQLHVEVSVDETDVSQIALGDPVTVTLDSLPDLVFNGEVSQISRYGTTVQGLVKYTVRVDVTEADPQMLIGMTANANIVTDTDAGALAVPLDAVQLDADGEFVNRLNTDGTTERVNVVSGEVQDDLVVITGALQPGETVQIVEPQPTSSGSPFGPG